MSDGDDGLDVFSPFALATMAITRAAAKRHALAQIRDEGSMLAFQLREESRAEAAWNGAVMTRALVDRRKHNAYCLRVERERTRKRNLRQRIAENQAVRLLANVKESPEEPDDVCRMCGLPIQPYMRDFYCFDCQPEEGDEVTLQDESEAT